MTDSILEVTNLIKDFENTRAVNDISFVIPKGKIIGLLGPNGAGKTTTIHMLVGITQPTYGSIKYFGRDFYQSRQYCLQRINFTSSYNSLQERITVWENLLVFSLLYNIKNPKNKIEELIHYFEIKDLLNREFIDLSSGQKTRVNLVKALLNDPELILMDEPTASLDPDIADKTLSLIEKLKKDRQLAILYTSHNMDEVTRICDEVIFLDHGKIVAHDTPLGLTKQVGMAKLTITFDGERKKLENVLESENIKHEFGQNNRVVLTLNDKRIPNVIFKISKADIWITDIEVKKPDLEDVFLNIVRSKKS